MIQHADAAAAGLGVTFEGEVHLLDAVALGTRAELRFGPGGRAAEENEVRFVHDFAFVEVFFLVLVAAAFFGRFGAVAAFLAALAGLVFFAFAVTAGFLATGDAAGSGFPAFRAP